MRNKSLGSVLIVVGAVLIAMALGLFGYNLWTQERAGDTAQVALDALKEVAHEATSTLDQSSENETVGTEPNSTVLKDVPNYLLDPYREMPEQEIDGVAYIGYLEIPALELELPVISTSTSKYLQLAPCRFYGSPYLDNLVIGAHNYSTHFGNIGELENGDLVIFTDMDRNVFTYQVADQIILQPDESEILCDGEYPLSLYTCTVGGSSRVTIRCKTAE